MGRFETKRISRPENLATLDNLPGGIDKVHQRRLRRTIVLDRRQALIGFPGGCHENFAFADRSQSQSFSLGVFSAAHLHRRSSTSKSAARQSG
jgi:hypothetical protein